MHTTNYYNTFIEIAEDSKVLESRIPKPGKTDPTIAEMQYEMLAQHPYRYTSDEVLVAVHMQKNDIPEYDIGETTRTFFSKGQPCFRCSPLTKTHGFGVHFDSDGKMALYGVETEAYEQWKTNPDVQKVKAMRSSRK